MEKGANTGIWNLRRCYDASSSDKRNYNCLTESPSTMFLKVK